MSPTFTVFPIHDSVQAACLPALSLLTPFQGPGLKRPVLGQLL